MSLIPKDILKANEPFKCSLKTLSQNIALVYIVIRTW
jgi:hypothetical protein